MRRVRPIRVLQVVLVAALVWAQGPCSSDQKREEALGKQYAEEFEKEAILVTDATVLERVNRIGQAVAKAANEYETPALYGSSEIYRFKYRFKVIEDEDVNAMSLPGGIVYVNTGLLKLAASDDELAGVLAHEVAHAAHHHLTYLLSKRSAVDRYVALVALAGIIGNARARDMNNLMMGAQMLKVGKLSGYTQQAEKDADRTAVAYLARSGHKAEGILTFMTRLQEQHAANPSAPLGIFQTHPSPFRRTAAILKAMRELGLAPDARRLHSVACAASEPVAKDSDRYRVVVCGKTIYEPAAASPDVPSKVRADGIAAKLNSLLEAGMSTKDILCDSAGSCLLVKQSELISVQPEDAALAGKTKTDLLVRAREALEYAIWADWLANRCSDLEDSSEP